MFDVSEGLTRIAERLLMQRRNSLNPCFIGYRGLPDISDKRFEIISAAFDKGGVSMAKEARYDISDFHEISQSVMDWVGRNGFNAVLLLMILSPFHSCRRRKPGDCVFLKISLLRG